jgi:hypothetical protein
MDKQNELTNAKIVVPQKRVLQLADHNFRIDSTGWERIIVGGEEYLENPERDVWEIIQGYASGEQLFTWYAQKRETAKVGKLVPTNKEWSYLVKEKEDIPNLVLAGYRRPNGSFIGRGSYGFFWTSSYYRVATWMRMRGLFTGSPAWWREVNSFDSIVSWMPGKKTNGFSVRCFED